MSDKNLTVIEQIRRDRLRAARRAAREAARESTVQNQLSLAIDRVQDERLSQELGPIFRLYGHALVPEPQVVVEFRKKAQDLIARDREYEARERMRAQAEIEVSDGVFVNLGDTVVEPTPEWLAKGEYRTFRPKQPAGTVREVKSVRRVLEPRVVKMHQAGNLSDDHLAACLWYRDTFELAGLSGRVKSSNMSLAGNVGGGGGGMGQAPMALHQREAEARILYREARAAITSFYVRFFEAIVLNDAALARAAKYARCRNERAPRRFRDCCNELHDFLAKNKIVQKRTMIDD